MRLARGVRLQCEAVTRSRVLLFPEGVVDLNASADAILSCLPAHSREECHAKVAAQTGSPRPLAGFDQFVDDALAQRWVVAEERSGVEDSEQRRPSAP